MNVRGCLLSWIVVKDLKEAVKFYSEVVGLTLLEESPEYGWAELSGPEGSRLGLAQYSEENNEIGVNPGDNAILGINVEDLDLARKHFQEKGACLLGEIVEVPGHVRLQTFADADGNLMQLVQKMD